MVRDAGAGAGACDRYNGTDSRGAEQCEHLALHACLRQSEQAARVFVDPSLGVLCDTALLSCFVLVWCR